jgi:hypothetical protein
VDIAVFETPEKTSQPYNITPANAHGITMGQAWFIGYPFGLHSVLNVTTQTGAKSTVLPFMKRGTMSAIDGTNPDAVVYYIDGFNNPGFSGGPIIFWNFDRHVYQIIGVVKGYREDTAKVLINGQHVDTQLLVNSGILVAYGIQNAIDAIQKSLAKHP